MPRPLIRHTIVIWTEDDLDDEISLEDLGRDADQGGAYCASHVRVRVDDPLNDSHPPSDDFFDLENDGCDEEAA